MAQKEVIGRLEKYIKELIEDHRRLGDLHNNLSRELESQKIENRELKEQVKGLSSEVSKLRLAQGLTGKGQDSQRARARVNQLMREVDKCIALLGSKAGE